MVACRLLRHLWGNAAMQRLALHLYYLINNQKNKCISFFINSYVQPSTLQQQISKISNKFNYNSSNFFLFCFLWHETLKLAFRPFRLQQFSEFGKLKYLFSLPYNSTFIFYIISMGLISAFLVCFVCLKRLKLLIWPIELALFASVVLFWWRNGWNVAVYNFFFLFEHFGQTSLKCKLNIYISVFFSV